MSAIKTSVVLSLFIGLNVLIAPANCGAAEGGWGLANLNPFKGKSGPPTSTRTSNPPTSGWKWPSLWTESSTTTMPRAKPAGPSTLQKMNATTKSFFSKTADALNPWDDGPEPEPKLTGSRGFRRASGANEEPTSSFLPSWSWLGGGEEEEKKPKTVNDFLMQPRPDY
jgi:hypothetical protein